MRSDSLLLRQYLAGDIDTIPCVEADPWHGWAQSIEKAAGDLRTILLDGKTVACFGFVEVTPGVADSLAVVDRASAAGQGAALAKMISRQTLEWMDRRNIHRAAATCQPSDRVAQVFLRAIGYRRECTLEAAAADGTDLVQFKLIRRHHHGQNS